MIDASLAAVLVLFAQAYDPLSPSSATPTPPPRPAASRPGTDRAPGPGGPPPAAKYIDEALIESVPTTGLSNPLAARYLRCGSVYAVANEMMAGAGQLKARRFGPDPAHDQVLAKSRALSATLVRRGREIAAPSERAAYDLLKPVVDRWMRARLSRDVAGFAGMPRWLGCLDLPEAMAVFPRG